MEPAAIEIRKLGGTQRVARTAIEAARLTSVQRHRHTVMLRLKGQASHVGTRCLLATDDAFAAWFAGLPDTR